MSFEYPIALLLLVPATWVALQFAPEGPGSRVRRAALRWATLSAATLALAGPQIQVAVPGAPSVVAIDVSQSVSPAWLGSVLDRLAALEQRQPHRFNVVAFADGAQQIQRAADLRDLRVGQPKGPLQEGTGDGSPVREAVTATTLGRSRSDLLDAAAVALADKPARILLLSDGNFEADTFGRALEQFTAAEVPVSTVVAASRTPKYPLVVSVRSLTEARAGSPTRLEVEIVAPLEMTVELDLTHAGADAAETGTEALASLVYRHPGGLQKLVLEPRIEETGDLPLVLALRYDTDDDGLLDAGATYPVALAVGEPLRVLYVEGEQENARYFARALDEAGFDVIRQRPGAIPTRAEELATYDVVVLSDTNANDLPPGASAAVATWVRDLGGGLLFAGGENTYGENGWSDTPIERVLPLELEVEEEESDVAMVIVLDKSYSMRGEKIELAKAASVAALGVLEDRHHFGLIAFDWNPTVVVPLRPASERDAITELIGRIEATAQTNFFPALVMASDTLEASTARTKHIVLLSDGKTYPDAYQRLLAELRESGITVSTVAVGAEADKDLLGQIAEWGGGRSYVVEDAQRVVNVLVEEAEMTLQDSVIEESTQVVVTARAPFLDGVRMNTAPPIDGYVAALARDRAEVVLQTPDEKPVLASWNIGQGRSIFFTSDLSNRWSADWITWRDWGRLWAQVVRDLGGRSLSGRTRVELERLGSTVTVTLTATTSSGRPAMALEPALVLPSGDRPMNPIGPGRYQAQLQARPASAPITITTRSDDGLPPGNHYLSWPQSDEFSVLAPNPQTLALLARATGGKQGQDLEEALASPPGAARHPRLLAPWLAALALLLFLFEILSRRLPIRWPSAQSAHR